MYNICIYLLPVNLYNNNDKLHDIVLLRNFNYFYTNVFSNYLCSNSCPVQYAFQIVI